MIAFHLELQRAVRLAGDGASLRWEPTPEPAPPDRFVSSGWIDVQVNGFAGYDVNADDMGVADFEAMIRRLHEHGTTRLLPTVITGSERHMAACLRRVADARERSPRVREAVPGLHLEGPFLSPEDGARGAHPASCVRAADPALFDLLQEAAGGAIRLVTLAPEVPGALELTATLHARGVVVAIGHSLADAAVLDEAVAAGARLSTHLGNGLPALLPRHPNPLWDQLADDRLYASAIFDGHHLPPSVMRVLARVKGPRKLILTSDAVALAGRPPGVYQAPVGGRVELHPDNRLTMYGTDYLAGSASSLADGVHQAVARAGLTPRAALRAVTRTPAELLELEPRDDWTLVRFEPRRLRVLAVASHGRLLHDDGLT